MRNSKATPQIRIEFVLSTAYQICLYLWAALLYIAVFARQLLFLLPYFKTSTTKHLDLVGWDFARFWYAGRHFLIQLGLAAPPPSWFMPAFKLDILSPAVPFVRAWNYPPTMALLAMPFALLPLVPSFWAWRIFSWIVFGALLRRAGLGWPVILAGLLSPAALQDFCDGGQNGTLLSGIMVASLLMADRKPGIAGVLAGLFIVKPQMGIVFPFIAARRSRVKLLLLGIVTGLCGLALSWIVLGWQPWWFFLNVARPDEIKSDTGPFLAYFPAQATTIFFMMRSFGATVFLAGMIQTASSLFCLAVLYLVWKPGKMQPMPRLALTCCLAALSTPHGYNYDLVAWSVGIAVMFPLATAWQKPILATLWSMPVFCVYFFYSTETVTFPIFAAIAAVIAWQLRYACSSKYPLVLADKDTSSLPQAPQAAI